MNKITRRFVLPNKKEIDVYKIFYKYKDDYFSEFSHYRKSFSNSIEYFKFHPIGVWNSCYIDRDKIKWENIELTGISNESDNFKYPTGFHSFLNYEQAYRVFVCKTFSSIISLNIKFILCKCKAKYRILYGENNYWFDDSYIQMDICVSRGIKIIEELE